MAAALAPNASAIVLQMMPGQAAGTALAAVLFGTEEPTGRLPISFPHSMSDTWLNGSLAQYPGIMTGGVQTATYSEGLHIGYRWFDQQQQSPLFAQNPLSMIQSQKAIVSQKGAVK